MTAAIKKEDRWEHVSGASDLGMNLNWGVSVQVHPVERQKSLLGKLCREGNC